MHPTNLHRNLCLRTMWLKKTPNLKIKQLEGEKNNLVGVKGIIDADIVEVVHFFLLVG